MKRFYLGLFLLAGSLAQVSVSRAGDIYFGGDGPKAQGSSGVLQILFNTLPENYTFKRGGIDFQLHSSNPGVIQFTSGTVINGDGRWDATAVHNVNADAVGRIVGVSVDTPGLPIGNAVLYAEIQYDVIGPIGSSTEFSIELNLDGLYDGTIPPLGADVSSSFVFTNGLVTVIPEPSCMILGAVGMIFLGARRR